MTAKAKRNILIGLAALAVLVVIGVGIQFMADWTTRAISSWP